MYRNIVVIVDLFYIILYNYPQSRDKIFIVVRYTKPAFDILIGASVPQKITQAEFSKR